MIIALLLNTLNPETYYLPYVHAHAATPNHANASFGPESRRSPGMHLSISPETPISRSLAPILASGVPFRARPELDELAIFGIDSAPKTSGKH